jgi:hypothetical protein
MEGRKLVTFFQEFLIFSFGDLVLITAVAYEIGNVFGIALNSDFCFDWYINRTCRTLLRLDRTFLCTYHR